MLHGAAIAGAGLSLIPGVGTAIGIGAAAAAAGLDLSAINSQTGVEFEAGDMLVHATNGEACWQLEWTWLCMRLLLPRSYLFAVLV